VKRISTRSPSADVASPHATDRHVFGIGSHPDALYLSQRRRDQMRSLTKGTNTT
jgi:hypothetical protein